MNYDEVKEKVEYYEKRVLTEFDKYFSYLVLEDFYSDADVGRIEDEWFYEEYFEQYEDSIINLLWEIENKDVRYYDFQLRLIKLKRIIDNKLIKLNKEPNSAPIRQSRVNYFILLTNIDNNKYTDLLHTQLSTHNFIECTIDNFRQLFQKNTEIDKIQWKGTELQITYLFNYLIRYMDDEVNNNKYKLIQTYFTNKKGNRFNTKQLGSVYSDKNVLLPNNDSILEVLKEMSTHF